MKKLLSSSIIFVFVIFSSCKKDTSLNNNVIQSSSSKINYSLSTKGYLNFKSTNDIVAFGKKLLDPKTKVTLLEELSEMGFKKRNVSTSLRPTDPSNPYNIIFNSDGILEVNNVIIKITDDDKFLITLKELYLNDASFNNLVNAVYDPSKMNKINVDRNVAVQFDLVGFTNINPYGHEEELNTEAEKVPFFGKRRLSTKTVVGQSETNTGTGGCHAMSCTRTTWGYYAAWILVDTWEVDTDCHYVYVAAYNGQCQ